MAIKIKRSTGDLAPASLAAGQLAYSEGSSNGGTLYYGEIGGTVREIAGRKFVDKVNGIEAGAEVNTVDSVNGQTGAVTLGVGDINGAESTLNKGQANGYAGLDSAGLVPASQLPSYVDDVIEGANLAAFPETGETGKIYVAIDTGKTYRWSGTIYVEISASPGSTDAVTEGTTNLYYTDARARSAISATGDVSYNSSTGVISYSTPAETDPVFTASPAGAITGTQVTNWDTAYGWGDHAAAGYLTNLSDDLSPSLAGDLETNGNAITANLDGNIDIVVTGTGAINLSHGDPDGGNFVRVGNGVNDGVIQSAGNTELFLGGAIVNLFTDKVAVGTGEAASTITSNGAYNLTIGTNAATVGTSPLITLNQNSGITLQATGATNSVQVLNSTFQHFMNSHTAASGTAFLQAHETADANNFQLTRARGTTATPSAVQTGDELAEFFVTGHDGQTGVAGYEQAWGFTTTVTDTPSSNVIPTITEFVINTGANTRTVYHSIEPDLVFRVKELGLISGETDLNITADAGSINLAHGDPDSGQLIRVGNGTDYGAIASNGAQDLTFGADIENIAGPVVLTLGSDGNIFLTPRAGSTVDIETSVTRLGTSEAAATLTSNGAYNLTIGTNAATVGTSPLITLNQNSGIVLQATANTNSIQVLNSTFQHFMNNHTAGAQAFFLQAHTTADANNFSLGRARGTTLSPSAVQTGDELAEFFVSGHDGQTGFAGYEAGWGFTTTVIDTPTSNVMPVMTEFKINTDENEMTTYHSISAEDGVFRVISLGAVDGETDLAIDAPDGGNVVISGLSYPAADGTANQVLKTDGSGNLSFVDQAAGVTTFVALTDTPNSFSGAAGYYAKVNSGATALEFSQDVDDGTF